VVYFVPAVDSTCSNQQPTANSQQPTANRQQPTAVQAGACLLADYNYCTVLTANSSRSLLEGYLTFYRQSQRPRSLILWPINSFVHLGIEFDLTQLDHLLPPASLASALPFSTLALGSDRTNPFPFPSLPFPFFGGGGGGGGATTRLLLLLLLPLIKNYYKLSTIDIKLKQIPLHTISSSPATQIDLGG